MQTNQLSASDRETLLKALRAFRAHCERGDGYTDRDKLEAKLRDGTGVLSDVDLNVLSIAIGHEIADDEKCFELAGKLKQ